MKNKWLKLCLNSCDLDIETFINVEENLLLQNHVIRGWEILPNTDDPTVVNNFYNKFKKGIHGKTKESCLFQFNKIININKK